MSKGIICAALGAVVALGIGSQSIAADAPVDKNAKPHMMKGMEKCYGIAKAGKNDCGSVSQSCSAQSKADNEKTAWLALPKGTCDKIVGGSTKPPAA